MAVINGGKMEHVGSVWEKFANHSIRIKLN